MADFVLGLTFYQVLRACVRIVARDSTPLEFQPERDDPKRDYWYEPDELLRDHAYWLKQDCLWRTRRVKE